VWRACPTPVRLACPTWVRQECPTPVRSAFPTQAALASRMLEGLTPAESAHPRFASE